MKQIFQHLNRHQSVRLFLPVFLGFVILTASTNLPDFDEAAVRFESVDFDTSLISNESALTKPSESIPDLSYEKALGWGSKSEVLP